MEGQLSIWDLQQFNLADKYEDGIPETIQEVVEIVEQRTGLKFKELKPYKSYKSVVGMYRSKYKKVTFELSLGRFVEDVHGGSRFINTGVDGGMWGRGVPAYDIDETIDLIKAWKEQV